MLRTPSRSRKSSETSDSLKTVGGAQHTSPIQTRSKTRGKGSAQESERTTASLMNEQRIEIAAQDQDSTSLPEEQMDNGQINSVQSPRNEVRDRNDGLSAQNDATPNSVNADTAPRVSVMEEFRNALRALAVGSPELPEFSGRDHEDPAIFIRECEVVFVASGTDAHARVRLAARALKDDAARWWAVYKNLNVSWEKFCELLRGKYASQTVTMKLTAKLYGQPQTDKEGTSLFLEQRHLLARRLLPNVGEAQIITVLLESLKGSTRKLLRSSHFDTVEDLITRAVQVEQDEAEERNSYRRAAFVPSTAARDTPSAPPARNAVTVPSAPIPSSVQSRTLPRCNYCPERHWHRDCPKNPHHSGVGNASGTGTAAAKPAPGAAAP